LLKGGAAVDLSFLDNPWIVGIGGGLLSGGLVTVGSRVIFSRRADKEYFQRVAGANNEVIFALKPGISEGAIPDHSLMESLIHATARKYRVEQEDAYGVTEIIEDLVKEVMDSSFISSKQKLEFCTQLEKLAMPRRESKIDEVANGLGKSRSELAATYRLNLAQYMSVGLGLLAGLMSFVVLLVLALTKTTITAGSEEGAVSSSLLWSLKSSSTGLFLIPVFLSLTVLLILQIIAFGMPRLRKRKPELTVSELAGQGGSQGNKWELVLKRATQRKRPDTFSKRSGDKEYIERHYLKDG
jgi:hypothetical protein